MQNLELVDLKCVTYAQPISLSLTEKHLTTFKLNYVIIQPIRVVIL